MTQQRFWLLALLLLVSWASAEESYFPHRDGLSWTYDNSQTQILSGPREVGGQSVMVLTNYLDGRPVSEEYLMYEEDGVFFMGTAAAGQTLIYSPPLLLYQGNKLQVGQSWQSQTTVRGLEITLKSEVLGVSGVQTPAGRFNALKLRQITITNTGAQTELELYYVPTVGVVRWVTQDGTVINLIQKNF